MSFLARHTHFMLTAIIGLALVGCSEEITCEEQGLGVDGIATESWMETLYADSDAVLNEILIPGTHNSGSYAITSESDVSSKSGQWFYEWAKPVVAGWSKTQACDVGTQLFGGNRYLDLRLEWHNDAIWIVHGMYSDTFENVLSDIALFARANPKEIVIVDIAKVTAPAHFDALNTLMQRYLGELLISTNYSASSTLHELWNSGEGNVIAVFSSSQMANYSEQYWYRRDTVDSDWANSGDASEVYEHITEAMVSRADNMFTVAQAVATPTAESIRDGILGGPNNLWSFSQPITENVVEWLRGWVATSVPANIIMTDFYDRHDVVAATLRANRDALGAN